MISKIRPKSEFSRNVVTLMTGTTIAQAIPIAISPILTRIYTPEDFGIFALYVSIASVIALIATGRYELAIMLPKKDEDSLNIVIISILITFLVSLLTFLVIMFFNEKIVNIIGNQEISKWLYFIPLTVLLTGFYQSFNYWFNRKKQYKDLSNNKISQSSSMAGFNLGFGFLSFGSAGLILGQLLGHFIAISIFAKKFFSENPIRYKDIKKTKSIALMKKYSKFPKYNLPNAIIDGLRLSGINILIAKFYATATLGQFSLAWKMVQMPLSIIGSSLSQVFFQKISTVNKSELHEIVKYFILKSSIISVPVFIIIYLFAPLIFKFIFGNDWEVAGQTASIMTPWLFLNFLASPLANVYIVLGRQELVLIVSIIYMALPISILYFFHSLGFLEVLNLITLFMSIILILYIMLALKLTKKENNELQQ